MRYPQEIFTFLKVQNTPTLSKLCTSFLQLPWSFSTLGRENDLLGTKQFIKWMSLTKSEKE